MMTLEAISTANDDLTPKAKALPLGLRFVSSTKTISDPLAVQREVQARIFLGNVEQTLVEILAQNEPRTRIVSSAIGHEKLNKITDFTFLCASASTQKLMNLAKEKGLEIQDDSLIFHNVLIEAFFQRLFPRISTKNPAWAGFRPQTIQIVDGEIRFLLT